MDLSARSTSQNCLYRPSSPRSSTSSSSSSSMHPSSYAPVVSTSTISLCMEEDLFWEVNMASNCLKLSNHGLKAGASFNAQSLCHRERGWNVIHLCWTMSLKVQNPWKFSTNLGHQGHPSSILMERQVC